MSKYSSKNYFIHFLQAAKFSFQGLIFALKNEVAFRSNCFLFVLSICLSIYLEANFTEFWLLNIPFFLIIAAEFFNTAIENIVDHFEEHHERLGAAKDLGSAAVATVMFLGGFVWLHFIYVKFF